MTRFNIGDGYAKRFEVQTVGARMHQELWVPAEELEEFNANMIGSLCDAVLALGGYVHLEIAHMRDALWSAKERPVPS